MLPLLINNREYNYKEYESELLDFERSIKSHNSKKPNTVNTNKQENKDNINQLFRFDPNTVNENELAKLGFGKHVIRNIIKYRSNGGFFYRKEDLLKIYGMDTSFYNSLVTCIYVERGGLQELPEEKNNNYNAIDDHELININRADTSLLTGSLGLERKLSERTIRYRNLLGGYSDKSQFNEIYGITKVQCGLLAANVFIDTTLIRKININHVNEQNLAKHPYLNDYYAKAITKYKEYAGEIKKINELSVNNILPERIYLRIRPYLSVN